MADRVAIVHERITEIGGSEHVVEQLANEWPDAEVIVPFADPDSLVPALVGRVRTTGLDRLHRVIRRRSHAPLLPLVPMALRNIDVGDVDALIVSHHAMAISAVAAASVPTVAYVHSPARWAWDRQMRAGEASSVAGRAVLAAVASITRRTESASAPKVTRIIANSTEVADRIRTWWGRESTVIFPPVDIDRFTLDTSVPREDFFLLAGRLVPYKRPDLAIRAARQAGKRLVVAGDGRQRALCERLADENVTFLGRVSDDELVRLQRSAAALLMPGVEDFGIVPVEAMASGTPVIAVGSGGALDTVVPGLSGAHVPFHEDDNELVAGFASAMAAFSAADFDPVKVRAHSEGFSRNRFRREMRAVVDDL